MLASALHTIDDRSPGVRSQSAQPNQNAAGARVKTPTEEMRLTAVKRPAIIASARFHRLNATRHTDKPAISQTTAITLEVTQSQVTMCGSGPLAKQPQGLDAITRAESNSAAKAQTPKTNAMTLVVRR